MSTPLGLAALTVLDTAPIEQIALAESCGYDTVGLRLLPAAPGTIAYPIHEDRRALRMIKGRLADSPVDLFDVEIIRIGSDFTLESYEPVLDAAAELGARALLVAGDDEDLPRLTANYASLAMAAAERGLVASLEFMPWTAVPDARTATDIVARAHGPGRSVLVDTLHAGRSTTTLRDLREIPREWIHYVQLCDAVVPGPTRDEDLIRDAREHRLAPGEGGLRLAQMLAAMPPGTPVSVELPNEGQRRRLGTETWLRHLARAARKAEQEANEVRSSRDR